VVAGEVAGFGFVAGLGRLAAGLLDGLTPRDPVVLGLVMSFLFVVSLLAALGPAWVAAGRDPNAALHES